MRHKPTSNGIQSTDTTVATLDSGFVIISWSVLQIAELEDTLEDTVVPHCRGGWMYTSTIVEHIPVCVGGLNITQPMSPTPPRL